MVELAAEAGCSAIALTDHDTVAGIPEAQERAASLGIEVVAGVELSCHTTIRNVHLLGYFVDVYSDELRERLEDQRRLRDERNGQLVARLEELGVQITLAEVSALAGEESVGRPHFAAVLVRHGYANSIDDAFERYLGESAAAHIRRKELPAADGIRWIHEAGGVASWAHPVWNDRYPLSSVRPVLDELVEDGLDGIEALYSRYDAETRKRLVSMARSAGVVATGGSDFHGTYKPDLAIGTGLGDLIVPNEALSELRNRVLC